MRGDDRQQDGMFSYISPEARVFQDHPLRAIRTLVDEVLAELSPRFEGLYARVGPTLNRLARWDLHHREGMRLGMGLGVCTLDLIILAIV